MGRVETLKRCDPVIAEEVYDDSVGQVSFMESLFALNREPRDIGYYRSIVFFCTENLHMDGEDFFTVGIPIPHPTDCVFLVHVGYPSNSKKK
jgi:hypothetical protein